MNYIESKMANVNPTISIIILNVNRLNNPIKRQKLPDWIKKNKIQLYTAYRRHALNSKTQIENKRMKKGISYKQPL